MKRLLSLVVLATGALVSPIDAGSKAKSKDSNTSCCLPVIVNGAGSTLQGQTFNADGTVSTNASFTVVAAGAGNFQRVDDRAVFQYNAKDPVTGAVFAQGSSAGVNQTLAGTVDFGGTDTPPSASQVVPTGTLLNFPIVVAGVAPVFNLPNTTAISFPAVVLAGIFSGHYQTWGDVAAAGAIGINPLDSLIPVTFVVRADGSGTTGDFTNYLFTFPTTSSKWTLNGNGPFTDAQWRGAYGLPGGSGNFVSASQTSGVISAVNGTNGAIGYLGYNNFVTAVADGSFGATVHVGAVENKNGIGTDFVAPTSASISLATSGVTVPTNLLINTVNESTNPAAFPIASPTNIVILQCQPTKCRAAEIKEFLYYLITKGQSLAAGLGFGTLDQSIVNQYIANLCLIKNAESVLKSKISNCYKKCS